MKKITVIAAAALAAIALSGCASIVEGTTQNIAITAEPPTASCAGYREGAVLFTTGQGGGTVLVSKSRHAIDLRCQAPGYVPAHQLVDSSVSTMGAVGVGVDFGLTDYATGALNKYPDRVLVTLQPQR